MSDGVLTALITGVVTVIVAVVGMAGVWLGKTSPAEAPPPKRRDLDKVDADSRDDALFQAYERRIQQLERYIGEIESGKRTLERENAALRLDNAQLTTERNRLANEMTVLTLQRDLEKKRDG